MKLNLFAHGKVVARVLLDAVFPPSARSKRVQNTHLEHVSLVPQTHTALDIRITTLAPYKDRGMKDAVQSLKYERSRVSARLLANLLAEFLAETLAEDSLFTSPERVLLVPIPLARERMHERGYNQVTLALAQLSSQSTPAILRTDILVRTRETPHQTKLSRSERLTNLADCFALANPALAGSLKDHHIILIDDVTTTGATLAEASKVLHKTGAKVTALAFARA